MYEPEALTVEDVEAPKAPRPNDPLVATHKQSVVIDMVSVVKTEYQKLKKFYQKRWLYLGFTALGAFILGLILGPLGGSSEPPIPR